MHRPILDNFTEKALNIWTDVSVMCLWRHRICTFILDTRPTSHLSTPDLLAQPIAWSWNTTSLHSRAVKHDNIVRFCWIWNAGTYFEVIPSRNCVWMRLITRFGSNTTNQTLTTIGLWEKWLWWFWFWFWMWLWWLFLLLLLLWFGGHVWPGHLRPANDWMTKCHKINGPPPLNSKTWYWINLWWHTS